MPIRLDSRAPDFAQGFRRLLATKREAAADVEDAVRVIIADVAARGDRALIELTRKFDRIDLDQAGLRVSADEIATAHAICDRRALDALAFARERMKTYHRRQLPKDDRFTDALGVELGSRWTAIESVGLYVPGGTAAYPSSVLMNAVPAKVAGVPRLVMVVPAPDGKLRRWCWRRQSSRALTKSIGSVAPRPSPRLPTAPRPLRRSPRSGPARPMWPRPASRLRPGEHRPDGQVEVMILPTRPATPVGSPPISSPRPSMTPAPNRS